MSGFAQKWVCYGLLEISSTVMTDGFQQFWEEHDDGQKEFGLATQVAQLSHPD